MEYQKMRNLFSTSLHGTRNQASKFGTSAWVEVNDESRRTYSANRDIILQASIIRPSLCN